MALVLPWGPFGLWVCVKIGALPPKPVSKPVKQHVSTPYSIEVSVSNDTDSAISSVLLNVYIRRLGV